MEVGAYPRARFVTARPSSENTPIAASANVKYIWDCVAIIFNAIEKLLDELSFFLLIFQILLEVETSLICVYDVELSACWFW